MRFTYPNDISIYVATFYLRISGFWLATSRCERLFRNATILYSTIVVAYILGTELRDLYFSSEDLVACMYCIYNSVGMFLNLSKVIIVFIHKRKFHSLIVYMQENFWHSNYQQDEHEIIANAKYVCIYFVCAFTLTNQCTILSCIFTPIIDNFGKNESDRGLIFNLWVDFPLSMSPYFEIIYISQALSLYQSGVCYLCFDNIFCVMCFHVGGQFRVLQYRISKMSNLKKERNFNGDKNTRISDKCYAIFKNCVDQHQALIEFCDSLEGTFREMVLEQVIIFGILICFIGYQLVLVDLSVSYKSGFVSFMLCIMCQILMFTYSCDFVTQESMNVASAIYEIPWTELPMDKYGKMIRRDFQFVITRSRRACCLTACGFFPISLETYIRIMSTAVSYFTILRQANMDTVDA